MKSISAIKSRYESIARGLGAPTAHVHFATTPHHDGSPHVEQNSDGFCYVVTERGQEFERRRTSDPEELLYWLVSDLTWAMASEYELRHRVAHEDCRRLLFQTQLQLLARVKSEWSRRKRAEYDQILAEHPFRDGGG
jgi:hypothetical protein